jgi:hypothetical protein
MSYGKPLMPGKTHRSIIFQNENERFKRLAQWLQRTVMNARPHRGENRDVIYDAFGGMVALDVMKSKR